jgi:RimJ/RimL family protein N-acetyltransferase
MATLDDQKFGPVVDPRPAIRPSPNPTLSGRHITIIGATGSHAADLFDATCANPADHHLFDYLLQRPYDSEAALRARLEKRPSAPGDPIWYALLDPATGRAVGLCGLMACNEAHRTVEVGGVLYSPSLRRTRAATEAMFLLARYVFEELGYRRYEWMCNALNKPSWRAAERLGFQFEGVHRQHMIAKGRNRDTAWFSMLDVEWPERKKEMEAWLDDANFDGQGNQKMKLEDFRKTSSKT